LAAAYNPCEAAWEAQAPAHNGLKDRETIADEERNKRTWRSRSGSQGILKVGNTIFDSLQLRLAIIDISR